MPLLIPLAMLASISLHMSLFLWLLCNRACTVLLSKKVKRSTRFILLQLWQGYLMGVAPCKKYFSTYVGQLASNNIYTKPDQRSIPAMANSWFLGSSVRTWQDCCGKSPEYFQPLGNCRSGISWARVSMLCGFLFCFSLAFWAKLSASPDSCGKEYGLSMCCLKDQILLLDLNAKKSKLFVLA